MYVKGDECAYMFPRELTHHAEARANLEEMLANEHASRVFYVVEERDGQLHVLAYPRTSVLADAVHEVGHRGTSEPVEPVEPVKPVVEDVTDMEVDE